MNFRDLLKNNIDESEIKFQALSVMKEMHSNLADITFLDVLAVMSEDNPLKKDVQKLEIELNTLTKNVSDFIEKNMNDAVDMEQVEIEKETEKETEKEELEIKKAAAAKPAINVKTSDKEK